MNSKYEPETSCTKEGKIINFDKMSQTVQIELAPHSKTYIDRTGGRFEFEDSDIENDYGTNDDIVIEKLDNLIDVRAI